MKRALRILAAALLPLFAFESSLATPFPEPGKIIRIVVGVPAGGGIDTQARLVAAELAGILRTTVLVDNKPGANGYLAFDHVSKAKPDGYTILYTADTVVQVSQTNAAATYDPLGFTPISLGGIGRLVLVAHASVPGKDISEVISFARQNAGKLSCGAIGANSSSAMYAELLRREGGFDCTVVPYKGFSDVFNDLVAGRVHLMFAAGSGAVHFAKTGKVRILATAEARRTAFLPGVPTLEEQGLAGFSIGSWLGFMGPPGMDAGRVTVLNAAIGKALAEPRVHKEYSAALTEPKASTPAEFGSMVRESHAKWATAIKQIGLQRK
jgi:tripartite-type tricarboxylate transporter receptor subunit TctC